MPSYPTFNGGIVTQRPYSAGTRFNTQHQDNEHGVRYAFYLQATPSRVFVCNYPALTDGEATDLEDFFFDRHGPVETFDFTDPNTGTNYANCRFAEDSLTITDVQKNQRSAVVTILDFTP